MGHEKWETAKTLAAQVETVVLITSVIFSKIEKMGIKKPKSHF